MTNIVRTVKGAPSQARLAHPDTIRVLTVVATPDDVINADEEIVAIGQRVQERLRGERRLQGAPLSSRFVWLEPLRDATSNRLSEALGDLKPHVLHYIGHGSFDGRMGYLHLHDERNPRGVHKVSAEDFISVTKPHAPSLIVLNACEGAASAGSMFTGVAESLLRAKITRFVVAMQYPVTNDAAIEFAQGFYTALVAGDPVDVAVSMGRNAILTRQNERLRVEFITPVLYMGGHDAHLFDEPVVEVPEDVEPLARAADTPGPASSAQAAGFRGGPVEGTAPSERRTLIVAGAAVLIALILAGTALLWKFGADTAGVPAPDPGANPVHEPEPAPDDGSEPPDQVVLSPAPDITREWDKTQEVVRDLLELEQYDAVREVLEEFRERHPNLNEPRGSDAAADKVNVELTLGTAAVAERAGADAAFAAGDWSTAQTRYASFLANHDASLLSASFAGVFDGAQQAYETASANVGPDPKPTPPETRPPPDPQRPIAISLNTGGIGFSLPAVSFPTDSAQLDSGARRHLDRYAAFAAAHPGVRIEAVGTADRRGGDAHNLALGQRRAQAVADYLAGTGLATERIVAHSVGEAWARRDGAAMAADRSTRVRLVLPASAHIGFEFDSEQLSASGRAALADAARWARDLDVTLTVTGHADRRGSAAYNAALGTRRAETASAVLRDVLPLERIVIRSAGETQPWVVAPRSAADFARNRRIELAIGLP